MEILELMKSRHSVRQYLDKPIESEKKEILNGYAERLNRRYGTNVKIFFDDADGFKKAEAPYGLFSGCKNYIALIGKNAETCGYVGELLCLRAQEMGLNTCFVALTYKKSSVKKKIKLSKGEKLQCSVALGYGKTQGANRKSKTPEQVLVLKGERPELLDEVLEACLLAPTAINQQKFKVVCEDGKIEVVKSGFGFYADVDLGIVKCHKDLIEGTVALK
ncbi:MAG: nitroreductase family protein [Clostridia bacterium]|nr:nitroreductase family protein [Clostridia bacterium]